MNLERQLHIFGYLIWSDFNTRLSCVIAFSKIYVKLLIHREYFKERKCGRMVFMHEWVFWHKNNECVRDRSLFIVWRERGGGGKSGAEDFCFDNGALTWSPPKGYSVVLSPHIGGGRFHDPPSSIPATTKSQRYYMQGSDIYINTYVSWTLNSNFTYLVIWYEVNCLWRVTLLIQIVENKVIVALFLLTVEFFLIFLIPWFPFTLIFGTTRFVCVHRLFEAIRCHTLSSFRPVSPCSFR